MGAGNVAIALNAMQDADTDELRGGNRHERVNGRNYTRIDKNRPEDFEVRFADIAKAFQSSLISHVGDHPTAQVFALSKRLGRRKKSSD